MAARPQTPDPQLPSNLDLAGAHTPHGLSPVAAHPSSDPSPLMSSIARSSSRALSYRPGDDLLDSDIGPTTRQLEAAGLHRTASRSSKTSPSRNGTLKKQKSLSRKSSLKRSGSRKSLAASSVKSVRMEETYNHVFFTPIPTSGSPTDVLANRFQAWRKVLKDLITYFREIQTSYEARAKALSKVSNVINNTSASGPFMTEGGLNDANVILRDFHRQSVAEANKAREIENDVVTQLAGLRADLGQKIKEIKSLSGDFKNSVEKEKEHTRKVVNELEDRLAVAERESSALVGKDDPYIVRLQVERQLERQIDEENYLHRAYLNLEGSGRELESIIVGEIQKAYNALAGILRREADTAYSAVEQLRSGPITMPKDLEWAVFVEHDPHMISSDTPLRRVEDISYPGKNHPAAAEVRAGMLERKSKYLKSYTAGWYVLSPTHLHEFKSADHVYTQAPVMSLLLVDQKLGSHSQPGSSSHKFMLKGRQTGSMHRGHSWVFRAETYDTMLAWYDDIRELTEKTGEERNAFVRKHARSLSTGSYRASSVSGDSGLEEDEADEVPFSAQQSLQQAGSNDMVSKPAIKQRPQPGGRFPSDLQAKSGLQATRSVSSGSSRSRDSESARPSSSAQERHIAQDVGAVTAGSQLRTNSPNSRNPPAALAHQDAMLGEIAPSSMVTRDSAAGGRATQHVEAASAHRENPEGFFINAARINPNPPSPPRPAPPIPREHVFLNSATPIPTQFPQMADGRNPITAVKANTATDPDPERYWRLQREQAESRNATEIAALPIQRTVTGSHTIPFPTSLPPAPPNFLSTAPSASLPLPPPNYLPPAPPTQRPTHPSIQNDSSSISSTQAVVDLPTSLQPAQPAAATRPPIPGDGSSRQVSFQGGERPAPPNTRYDTNADGTVNARLTGEFMPRVLRHDTDVSVGELYAPGGFPRS